MKFKILKNSLNNINFVCGYAVGNSKSLNEKIKTLISLHEKFAKNSNFMNFIFHRGISPIR